MPSVNILDYAIQSAQGNLQQTIEAIKSENISISMKDDPYFLFEKEVSNNFDAIHAAIKKIVVKTASNLNTEQKKKTVLIIGTSIVDDNSMQAIQSSVYEDTKKPYASMKKSIDTYASSIAGDLCLNAFTMTISTACTSSANAMLEARNLISSEVCDYAIVVGVEVYSKIMHSGFGAMKLLSQSCQKPFDTNRDGLVLGEGIAGVLLGREVSSWSLLGGYSNCDSLTITSVSENGLEYANVMQKAMQLSKIQAENITALKAHATSTLTNDESEINAIKKVFDQKIIFTALKPYIGHTLGACGVLELVIFIESVENGFIPKTLQHTNPIIKEYTPLTQHKNCNSGTFMLNYFGFGGNNTSIIIQKV